jgi:hypothetical protein
VGGVAEAAAAVDDALSLDRHLIRQTAIARFSADRMVDDYVRVYEALLGGAAGRA